jgi:hypothetical protein
MFTLRPHTTTVLSAVKIWLVLGLLLLPFATLVAPTYARQTDAAPADQSSGSDNDVVVLKEVQNPDGTTTVTVRIYTMHNEPNALATNFWLS